MTRCTTLRRYVVRAPRAAIRLVQRSVVQRSVGLGVVASYGPAAYLLTFTFREVEPPAVTWLHLRLADTRTGAIVAAVSAPLDSLGATTLERARAIVDSLAASPVLGRQISPP